MACLACFASFAHEWQGEDFVRFVVIGVSVGDGVIGHGKTGYGRLYLGRLVGHFLYQRLACLGESIVRVIKEIP